MPFTPLHVAYPWLIRLKMRRLDFAGLTVGSLAPDLEIPILYLLGFFPYRLLGHSLLGTITIDIVFSLFLFWLFVKLNISRFGIHGFETFRVTRPVLLSMAIGSLTHVLVDTLHHRFNPLLWPVGGYMDGPLVSAFGLFTANLIVYGTTGMLLAAVVVRVLHQNRKLGLLVSRPITALREVTTVLSMERK